MTRRAVWALGVVAGLAATLAMAAEQPGSGPRGPRLGPMRGPFMLWPLIDRYWTGITFEVKLDNGRLAKLRPSFQEAWNARKQLLQQGMAGSDPEETMQKLKGINDKLVAAVTRTLTKSQMKQLQAFLDRTGPGFGRRGPGGPGGPGRPGGVGGPSL